MSSRAHGHLGKRPDLLYAIEGDTRRHDYPNAVVAQQLRKAIKILGGIDGNVQVFLNECLIRFT
jgi:hypothetical protein